MERRHSVGAAPISDCTSSTTGASTKKLMARMGHSTPRAALIHQHAASDRDQAITAALSELVTAPRPLRARDGSDGERRGARATGRLIRDVIRPRTYVESSQTLVRRQDPW